ncbi:MAG: cyclic pyranopterin monophosphate synthase MoaC [Saprospirales bacterium]|jgi:cyclic pyranopterin phosphate synthase|nr:cyclic pyranopterin monophosphate synthase MoaC [Saprospirales bacterium]
MSETFSHLDESGNPRMVDVGAKAITQRSARAQCLVHLGAQVLSQLQGQDWQSPKGPVFQTAILAGVMGAKKTGDLIPLCHPLGLDHCHIEISVAGPEEVLIQCTASVSGKTGVEMEALTGASIAALTLYDMCKALSHDIRIVELKLMEKTGGKKDFKRT